jgi:hypothetical protein
MAGKLENKLNKGMDETLSNIKEKFCFAFGGIVYSRKERTVNTIRKNPSQINSRGIRDVFILKVYYAIKSFVMSIKTPLLKLST